MSKWAEYESRLILTRPADGLAEATQSKQHVSESEEGGLLNWRRTFPIDIRAVGGWVGAQSSDVESRHVITDEDPMEISDGDLETEDDHLAYFADRSTWGELGACFQPLVLLRKESLHAQSTMEPMRHRLYVNYCQQTFPMADNIPSHLHCSPTKMSCIISIRREFVSAWHFKFPMRAWR